MKQPEIDPVLLERIEKIKKSDRIFIDNCLSIKNKQGLLAPFRCNRAQHDYWKKRSRFDYVLKARKMGFSTFRIASDIHKCAFRPNEHRIMLTHTDEAAQMMLVERVIPLIESSIIPLGAEVKRSEGLVYFPATNSRYYVGTAGAKTFGRGSDLTGYHLSEYAHWRDPKVQVGVEEGCIDNADGLIETTANGVNFAQLLWNDAMNGTSRYQPLFMGWFMDDGYSIPGGTVDGLDEYEKKLVEVYNLSHEQLAWRRWKLKDMSKPELFPQEYPSFENEAWLSSNRMVFDWAALIEHERRCDDKPLVGFLRDQGERIEFKPEKKGGLKVWEVPTPRHVYFIGADVAEGIKGGAYSAAFVLDIGTGEQVAEWHGHCSASDFGNLLATLGYYYNRAIIAPESWPGPGAVTTLRLKDLGYTRIYQRTQKSNNRPEDDLLGWATNTQTKQKMISGLDDALRSYSIFIKSKPLVSELRSFIYSDNANLKMAPSVGCFSDRVIAAAIAWECSRELASRTRYDTPRLRQDLTNISVSGIVTKPKWYGPRLGVRQE